MDSHTAAYLASKSSDNLRKEEKRLADAVNTIIEVVTDEQFDAKDQRSVLIRAENMLKAMCTMVENSSMAIVDPDILRAACDDVSQYRELLE